jgi:hypothetical protein
MEVFLLAAHFGQTHLMYTKDLLSLFVFLLGSVVVHGLHIKRKSTRA